MKRRIVKITTKKSKGKTATVLIDFELDELGTPKFFNNIRLILNDILNELLNEESFVIPAKYPIYLEEKKLGEVMILPTPK